MRILREGKEGSKMIFTTRPLMVQIEGVNQPIEDFINHRLDVQGINSYKRNIYFTRYIGFEKEEADYISEIKKIDSSFGKTSYYLRLNALDYYISPKESEHYLKIYEAWLLVKEKGLKQQFEFEFPVRLANDMLELTQKCAFKQAMDMYQTQVPKVSDSMARNFGVKLLGWISHYLPKLYQDATMVLPKVVYIGTIKRQEFLFLYFLSLMGCDVLYMNPSTDIKEAYPECERFSVLCKGRKHQEIQVPAFVKHQDKPVTSVVGGAKQQVSVSPKELRINEANKENKETSKGSINLPRPNMSRNRASEGNTRGNTKGNTKMATPPRNTISQQQSGLGTQSNKADMHPSKQTNQVVRPIGGLNHPKANNVPYGELSYEEIARLSTSIVMITILDRKGEAYKSGSGVVIHEDGYILTNFHVVEGGAYFAVRFENEDQIYETNRIVKYHTDYDLALIKVEKKCKPIRVHREQNLVRGQKVVAIGSPHGLFNSISDGIIAAFRQIREQDMIQFTAPISPGSSGGALLDMYGRLIGIITGHFDGQNLNLAVNNQMIEYFAANYMKQ